MSSENLPYVLWNTLTDDPLFTGVVASSNVVGFEPANVFDYKQNSFWEATSPNDNIDFEFSSSVSVDSLFFIGGTIAEESHDWSFQYWNGGGWVDIIAATTPTTDVGVFKFFASQAATKFRFNILQGGGAGTPTYISNILLGLKTEFERGVTAGFAYPDNADNPEVQNSVTQGGNFIGRTQQGPMSQVTVDLKNLTDSYVTNTWNPFRRHMQLKPFGFLPDPLNRPTDAAYAWTEGKVGPVSQASVGYANHSFKINLRQS